MKNLSNRAILAADALVRVDPLNDPGSLIVFAGDWHGGTESALDALDLAHAAGSRTVVHTGDFGIWPGKQAYQDAVAGRLALLGMSLMFVGGNHEDYAQIELFPFRPDGLQVVRPRLYHLPRAFRWNWPGGLRCLALGGAVSLDRPFRTPHIDWWEQEEITHGDVLRSMDGGPVDLMVTHDCPGGFDPPGLRSPESWPAAEMRRANNHRDVLRSVVDEVRPARLFHGHLHLRHDTRVEWPNGGSFLVSGLDQQNTQGNLVVVSLADLRADVAHRDVRV